MSRKNRKKQNVKRAQLASRGSSRINLANNVYAKDVQNVYDNPRANDNRSMNSKMLDAMLDCNKDCINGFVRTDFADWNEEVDWMIDNLPTLPYVIGKVIDFIFSNGLTTGDQEMDDSILRPFLFKHNARGVTNYSVIQDAIKQAILYGKCGIRWLDNDKGIVAVNYRNYTSIVEHDKEYGGFRVPIAYAISTDETIPIQIGRKEINIDEATFYQTGKLVTKDKTMLFVLPEDFCNLRNGLDHENGISCLSRDKQRTRLLASVYERLNYDIVYDGPGRMIFWLKDNFANGTTVDLSAGQVLDSTTASKNELAQQAQREAEELGKRIKNSKSDAVILASSVFDKMDHLPRVTKGTEFLDYLQTKEGSIICQCIGITPELIGLGDVSGNVSMERIIDNAMTNTIVPMREMFATQISPMLSAKLGIPKIYFDKYELKEQQDKSAKTYKLALSVSQIIAAVVNGESALDDKTKRYMMDSVMRMMDSIEKTL